MGTLRQNCKDDTRSARDHTCERWCIWSVAAPAQADTLADGKAVFGSHSCRRGGAQSLAKAGFSKRFISLWGRWESECSRLYVEQAELEGATAELGAAITTTSNELESQWKWVRRADVRA